MATGGRRSETSGLVAPPLKKTSAPRAGDVDQQLTEQFDRRRRIGAPCAPQSDAVEQGGDADDRQQRRRRQRNPERRRCEKGQRRHQRQSDPAHRDQAAQVDKLVGAVVGTGDHGHGPDYA
jgi:hypothetical protein